MSKMESKDTRNMPALPEPVRELKRERQRSVHLFGNDRHADAVTGQVRGNAEQLPVRSTMVRDWQSYSLLRRFPSSDYDD